MYLCKTYTMVSFRSDQEKNDEFTQVNVMGLDDETCKNQVRKKQKLFKKVANLMQQTYELED